MIDPSSSCTLWVSDASDRMQWKKPQISLASARNEHEAFQIVVQSECPLRGVRATYGSLTHPSGYAIVPEYLQREDTDLPSASEVCEGSPEGSVEEHLDQNVRLRGRIYVPEEAPEGVYRGEVWIQTVEATRRVPIVLEVSPFALPRRSHLWMVRALPWPTSEPGSEAFWTQVERDLRNAVLHRQNMVALPWPDLIRIYEGIDGQVRCDPALLDRYVALSRSVGIDRFILEPGWIPSGEALPHAVLRIARWEDGQVMQIDPLPIGSPRFDQHVGPLIRDLHRHLDRKGWTERCLFHLFDGLSHAHIRAVRTLAQAMRAWAPGLRRMGTLYDIEEKPSALLGLVDTWVLPSGARNKAFYEEGEEVWWAIPGGMEARWLLWLAYSHRIGGVVLQGGRDLHKGMEDYEYLYLLEEHIRRIEGVAAAPGIPSTRREELVQEAISARQVLENVLFCATSERTREDRTMSVLLAARRQVARKIARLSGILEKPNG